ncbi:MULTISPECIES: hypothetical protein [unclassified Thioalkalivibrio]|uniref:hypothetical protein n=1 Tax=unclassified Thioalkalivibrio TaxID=2621013 RepID=UPI00035E29B7|nr:MULTISPECIES: hypothetical protein [unclassified Thioalkalivibrio]
MPEPYSNDQLALYWIHSPEWSFVGSETGDHSASAARLIRAAEVLAVEHDFTFPPTRRLVKTMRTATLHDAFQKANGDLETVVAGSKIVASKGNAVAKEARWLYLVQPPESGGTSDTEVLVFDRQEQEVLIERLEIADFCNTHAPMGCPRVVSTSNQAPPAHRAPWLLPVNAAREAIKKVRGAIESEQEEHYRRDLEKVIEAWLPGINKEQAHEMNQVAENAGHVDRPAPRRPRL